MKKLAADVWTGLRTGPARAGLAFFSLTLGLFAATILLSTLDALRHQARNLVQAFGANSFVLDFPYATFGNPAWTRRHVDYFRANLGPAATVSGAKALPWGQDTEFPVMRTDEHLARARDWRFVAGRALDAWDIQHGARHAVASAVLCQAKRWHIGDLIPLEQEFFRLVGCYEATGDPVSGLPAYAVCIPYTAPALEMDNDDESVEAVERMFFRVEQGISPEVVQRRVAALLKQPGLPADDVKWITPESLLQGIRRWQRTIGWTAGVGGALGLLLGAVTLAGMLLTGVRERISEIGLRRALGAQRREIAGLFVAESLALTGAAGIVGLAAAEGILRWLGARFPLPFHFSAGTRIFPLALALGIALLCSTGPAWLAARLPPAEALRNE